MPHAGMLAPPEFPSNYVAKEEARPEGAAIPDKMAFNFFLPHETVCKGEQVRALAGGEVRAAARSFQACAELRFWHRGPYPPRTHARC